VAALIIIVAPLIVAAGMRQEWENQSRGHKSADFTDVARKSGDEHGFLKSDLFIKIEGIKMEQFSVPYGFSGNAALNIELLRG
jgi:hypothetical protein